jgi:hypothetical protein
MSLLAACFTLLKIRERTKNIFNVGLNGLVSIPDSTIRPNLEPTQSPSHRLKKAIYPVVKF